MERPCGCLYTVRSAGAGVFDPARDHLPEGFELYRGYYPATLSPPTIVWDHPAIDLFGKKVPLPRLTRWYGEAGHTYSGVENTPAPMPAWLNKIRQQVEADTETRFNSALLNYYRGGKDGVAWHSDDEKELGPYPVIASLSFGASRKFAVRSKGAVKFTWAVELHHGDLLVMRGESQRNYQHSVPKMAKEVGPRINITFRWIG